MDINEPKHIRMHQYWHRCCIQKCVVVEDKGRSLCAVHKSLAYGSASETTVKSNKNAAVHGFRYNEHTQLTASVIEAPSNCTGQARKVSGWETHPSDHDAPTERRRESISSFIPGPMVEQMLADNHSLPLQPAGRFFSIVLVSDFRFSMRASSVNSLLPKGT